MIRKITLFLVLAFMLSGVGGALSARGYALVEASSGRLIEGGNVDMKLPMASTTKIMTGLLSCESGKLDTVITIPAEALRIEGSSMYLTPGEKLTLREITYGLLLESGNDAANVIAYTLAGSVADFAVMMNNRARELGLKNTNFTNPAGLDIGEHCTTALDLARLGAAAMKNPTFREIVSTYKIRIPYNGIKDGRLLVNHNEMLNIYQGTIGIKTGYTRKSGRCLVTCAERNGVMIVAATLNGHDDWGDHTALLNNGFAKLKRYRLFAVEPHLTVPVVGGKTGEVRCSYQSGLEAALTQEEIPRVKMECTLPKFCYAPVTAGDKLGTITFTLDGCVLGETEVLANENVARETPNRFKEFLYALF